MGILKGIGIDSISLFSLDGIMEENRLLEFLDTINRAKPYKPAVCNYVIRNEVLSELLFNIGKIYYRIRR